MPHQKTSQQAIERAQRRAQAVQLRLQGHTIRAIAERLGVSVATAHGDVAQALADIPAESVEQLRQVWGDRLETAVQLVMDCIGEGDLSAVDKLVALTNRAARLWGLDAPQQVAMTGGTDVDLDKALRDYRDALLGDVEPYDPFASDGGQQS